MIEMTIPLIRLTKMRTSETLPEEMSLSSAFKQELG